MLTASLLRSGRFSHFTRLSSYLKGLRAEHFDSLLWAVGGGVGGRRLLALERLLRLSVMSQTAGEGTDEVPAVDIMRVMEKSQRKCQVHRGSDLRVFIRAVSQVSAVVDAQYV